MEKYEINKYIQTFQKGLDDMNQALNVEALEEEFKSLEEKMHSEGFWDDQKKAQEVISRANLVKGNIDEYKSLKGSYDDIIALSEMLDEGMDCASDLEEAILDFEKKFKDFEILILLSGPYDKSNAILELHPGAGGTESQDWCEMLYRMYTRYAQRHNFKIEVLDYLSGEEAGIKSVTILVKGKNAYGYLKAERGVHRLVRISPFDSNARRHTSFVSCDVMPEITDAITVEIKDEDIKVDVYHSSGAGGQSVNTTDSAVRITHKPTGIVVTCQNERSQIKNRESALMVLKSKLVQLKIKEQEDELKAIKGEQKEIGWGSQIRSYVFHPYSMVKDHRTNYEVGNTTLVMDGDIDEFINQFLKMSVEV